MKILFSLLIMFGVSIGCTSEKEEEVFMFSYFKGNGEDGLHLAYSYNGLKWQDLKEGKSFLKPAVGLDKLMRDPCIIRGKDELYHMVWTVSWKERGIGYATSPDFINWSEQTYLPVMEHEPEARNCWAPEIYYDSPSDQYMLIWSTTIPGRFAATDSTGDNDYNHRMYYTTTNDFKKFKPTAIFYDHGFNVIDGTLINDDGDYVLFLKDETRYPPEKNIRIATSDQLTGNYSAPSEPITSHYWAEGPTVVKVENDWIVYFDKYVEHTMGAVRSLDLEEWEDISEEIEFPEGTRHGSVFKVPLHVFEKLK